MVAELISLELSSYIKYPFIQSLQQVLPQMSIPEGWYVAEELNIHILQQARCGLVFYALFCQNPNCSTLHRFLLP